MEIDTFASDRKDFGCEMFSRLQKVLLHRPGKELNLLNDRNYRLWLFDRVPDMGRFIEEHDRYRELLTSLGVNVIELSDFLGHSKKRTEYLPNLTYLHDTAVISSQGAIVSAMSSIARKGEEKLVAEALRNMGIPSIMEFDEVDDAFEGCLMLSPETLLIADTERHNDKGIRKCIQKTLPIFKEIIYAEVPKARRYMHPDTLYNRVDHNLALAHLQAFQRTYLYTSKGIEEIDFQPFMKKKGVEIINVSDSEQRRLACSFVPLEPGVIIHYDTALGKTTRKKLTSRGVELVLFHPDAMVAGGGSLRCLTLRLHRCDKKNKPN